MRNHTQLTPSEFERLPECKHDWVKQKCPFKADNDHDPSLQDCYDCLFDLFLEFLDEERLSMAQHTLEMLRLMIKRSASKMNLHSYPEEYQTILKEAEQKLGKK